MNRRRRPLLQILVCVLLALGAVASISHADLPQLKVSGNGRHLQQADGTPFFWMGDTNWRLYKLSRAQITFYLKDRQKKEFNVIQGPLVLYPNEGPEFRNFYGLANDDPSSINEAWFTHIDYIVKTAAKHDLYIALVVTWGHSSDLFSSPAQAEHYGRLLGKRYRDHSNVIWIVAGEYSIEGTPPHIMDIWNALGRGLRYGCKGRNLITIHASFQVNNQSSSSVFHHAPWLDLNMIQSSQSGNTGWGADNWTLVQADHSLSPRKPTLDGEANYEGINGWDDFGVRRRAYWSVFAGACGHTYGAASVWQSYRPGIDASEFGSWLHWKTALNYAGARDMRYLRRLIESRPMLKRLPHDGMILSPLGGVPDHMAAMRDADGRFAMVYIPGTDRPFTVKMNVVGGAKARAWWYDPRRGKAKLIGTFASAGSRTFRTPNEGDDWVLVLDDTREDFNAPGMVPARGPLR